MKILISIAAAACLTAGSAMAQTAPAAPAPAQSGPQGQPATDVAVLSGSQAAPDCGNLYGLNGKAFCVSALMANVGTVAEAYIADLGGKGWLVAGGDDNRVVFVKRRAEGGCDGLQMQAFYDTTRISAPTDLGYLGFATIPGNICAAQPGSTPAAAQ